MSEVIDISESISVTKASENPEGVNTLKLYTLAKPVTVAAQIKNTEQPMTKLIPAGDQVTTAVKVINLEELANEKGISVEKLIAQLEQESAQAKPGVYQMEIKDMAIQAD